MKTAKLFKDMEKLVEKNVQAWKTDLEIDKKTIKENVKETTYYWYLRDSGTQLMSATDMQFIESGAPLSAEFWLDQAKVIYEINIEKQELKLIKASKMESLIKAAKHMSEQTKLEYLISWMSTKNIQENERPWEILYHNARAYNISYWKVDNLISKSATIKEILADLNELLSWSKAS